MKDYLKKKDIRLSTAQTDRNQCNNAFADWYKILVDVISSQMIADKHLKLIKLYSLNYPASCFRTLLAILETTDVQINPIKRAFKTWGWS